jgi:dihydroorotase
MVHVGNAPPGLGKILNLLDAGDVVTHAFHGKPGGILSADGKLIPEAASALKRGVHFDVGHGSSSFSFDTMAKAKQLGIHPYSISTDIYTENLIHGPVYSLTLTMTKFLALGYSLEKVIEWSTWAPAKALGRSGEIGTLRAGTIADITIFNVTEQPTELVDSEQQVRSYHQRIEPQYTIKTGEIYSCTT